MGVSNLSGFILLLCSLHLYMCDLAYFSSSRNMPFGLDVVSVKVFDFLLSFD